MAIYYVWGFTPPAPHRLGNATRLVCITHHDNACDVAAKAGFDVVQLTNAGTPAWATAYQTPDAQPFEPGADGSHVAGFTAVTAER